MIGFTSVSLRSYSIEDVVKTAVQAGAEIIEWGSDVHVKTLDDARKAKKLCDENGIKINSYGTYYRTGSRDEKQWKQICECAEIMSAKYIRTWLGKKGSAKTDDAEYAALLDDARSMADTAAQYGLVICHECHPNTYNDTTDSCLKFLKDVDRDNIKTYYQSWYRDENGDRDKLFRTFPYVQDVHLSFSELKKFQFLHEKDKKYISKILAWLKELDFSGGLIIEFTKGNRAENLIKDTERLRKLW